MGTLSGKCVGIECREFVHDDAPANPMHFGRWKDNFYLTAAKCVRRDSDASLKWLAEIEGAFDIGSSGGPLGSIFFFGCNHPRNFLQEGVWPPNDPIQYKRLHSQYLGERRTVIGRQAAWLYFQKYLVDDASRALHQSKYLQSISLGSPLLHFLKQSTEHVAFIDVAPGEMELYTLFVDQVRHFKPMQGT